MTRAYGNLCNVFMQGRLANHYMGNVPEHNWFAPTEGMPLIAAHAVLAFAPINHAQSSHQIAEFSVDGDSFEKFLNGNAARLFESG